MTNETEVWKWLRDCKSGTYTLARVSDLKAFITAVKSFIDVNNAFETGYVIEFNGDYTRLKKFEVIKEVNQEERQGYTKGIED